MSPHYEGHMWIVSGGATHVKVWIPRDDRVPKFCGAATEDVDVTPDKAMQTAARQLLRRVHSQLVGRLSNSPYRYLPMAMGKTRTMDEN